MMVSGAAWRLWIDEPRPGWANMSVDLGLLDAAEQRNECWLRLYQWEPHCLSFGRHEPAFLTYDVDRIRSQRLDTVRRPTGGRAVWHARELTYAVAAPWQIFGSLRSAYFEIHRLLSQALGRLGISSTLAPRVRTAALDSGACFSQPVGGELLAGGRKLVGSAQLRRGRAFLQHGSILLGGSQQVVANLRRNSGAGDQVTDLSGWPGPLAADEVADQIADCAASQWPGQWDRVSDPEPILEAAVSYIPQFQSSTWTWAR